MAARKTIDFMKGYSDYVTSIVENLDKGLASKMEVIRTRKSVHRFKSVPASAGMTKIMLLDKNERAIYMGYFNPQSVKEVLKIPEHYKVSAILASQGYYFWTSPPTA